MKQTILYKKQTEIKKSTYSLFPTYNSSKLKGELWQVY